MWLRTGNSLAIQGLDGDSCGPAGPRAGRTSRAKGLVGAAEFLNKKDGYEVSAADQQMEATGHGQLVGQFLLDRKVSSRRFRRVSGTCSGRPTPKN
jgi:hypothetical protein